MPVERRFAAIIAIPTVIRHDRWYDLNTCLPACVGSRTPLRRAGARHPERPGHVAKMSLRPLSAFPNELSLHRFVRQTVRPIGRIFRAKGPFQPALLWIGGIFYSVEGIDDGLFLLMIEGIGLAKHHILEYLWLCFRHEGNKVRQTRATSLSRRLDRLLVLDILYRLSIYLPMHMYNTS